MSYFFLLPLLILVIYLGIQQCRKRPSLSTTTSHSDVITYHSITMLLGELMAIGIFLYAKFVNLPQLLTVGISTLWAMSVGQAMFHILTCVERYLAVVHPITYQRLKEPRGVRIRNLSVGCVWVMSMNTDLVFYLQMSETLLVIYCCVMSFIIITVSFCSISVLCALRHPGPGEVGGNRDRADQSKQRAFHIITVILGVLLIKFGGTMMISMLYSSVLIDLCHTLTSTVWFDLPSKLVLPLLYLQRKGKLPQCTQNAESA